MNAELLDKLQKPFPAEDVKQRAGRGQMTFSYVPIGDVIRRMLVETKGSYSWEVVSLSYQPIPGDRFMWVCHGRLTLADQTWNTSFDGIGTHPAMDEESPKAAESDSFKRAAVKAGVALHLYDDPHSQNGSSKRQEPMRETAQVQAGRWMGPGRCPSCECVVNAPHKPTCNAAVQS